MPKTFVRALAAAAALALLGQARAASQYQWAWDGSQAAVVTVLSNDKDAGFLIIVNNDNAALSMDVNVSSRTMYLRRDNSGTGMFTVPEGSEFPLRVRSGTYKLYWGVGSYVNVKVRSGKTTTLAFDVFGAGGTGLRAVVHDGEKLNEYTLYDSADWYRRQLLDYGTAVRSGRQTPVLVTSTPVIVAQPYFVPDPPRVSLYASGAIRLFDLVGRMGGSPGGRRHDDRFGFDFHFTNTRWRRVSYAPPPPVVVMPPPPPVVVMPPPPPVIHRPPPPPVIHRPPPHRPPVVVHPPVILAPPPPPPPPRGGVNIGFSFNFGKKR